MLGTVSTAARFLSPGTAAGLVAGGVLLLALAGGIGWQLAAWKYGAQLGSMRAESAAERQLHAEAVARAQADARARYAADVELGQQAARSLLEYSEGLAQKNDELKRRVAHVTTVYRTTAGGDARPLPECIFTHGAVRLWNDAIGAGDPDAGTAADTRRTGAAPDAADTVDSGVRQPDALAAIADYGARCQQIERQLNAVLDYVEGLK